MAIVRVWELFDPCLCFCLYFNFFRVSFQYILARNILNGQMRKWEWMGHKRQTRERKVQYMKHEQIIETPASIHIVRIASVHTAKEHTKRNEIHFAFLGIYFANKILFAYSKWYRFLCSLHIDLHVKTVPAFGILMDFFSLLIEKRRFVMFSLQNDRVK